MVCQRKALVRVWNKIVVDNRLFAFVVVVVVVVVIVVVVVVVVAAAAAVVAVVVIVVIICRCCCCRRRRVVIVVARKFALKIQRLLLVELFTACELRCTQDSPPIVQT